MKKLFRHWKIIFLVCSLTYMGWVIHVAGNEFDRINSQYRRIVDQLDTGRIRSVALKELTDACRKNAEGQAGLSEGDCSSWRPQLVEVKVKEVERRLLRAKERGTIKAVLFYAGFVLIFLLGPPLFLYLVLVGSIRIYKSVTFVRDQD